MLLDLGKTGSSSCTATTASEHPRPILVPQNFWLFGTVQLWCIDALRTGEHRAARVSLAARHLCWLWRPAGHFDVRQLLACTPCTVDYIQLIRCHHFSGCWRVTHHIRVVRWSRLPEYAQRYTPTRHHQVERKLAEASLTLLPFLITVLWQVN